MIIPITQAIRFIEEYQEFKVKARGRYNFSLINFQMTKPVGGSSQRNIIYDKVKDILQKKTSGCTQLKCLLKCADHGFYHNEPTT